MPLAFRLPSSAFSRVRDTQEVPHSLPPQTCRAADNHKPCVRTLRRLSELFAFEQDFCKQEVSVRRVVSPGK